MARTTTTLALLVACSASEDGELPGVTGAGGITAGSGGDTACSPGTERCPCYGNGTCNQGLTCASDRCVLLPGGGGATGGGSGGRAGAGGTSSGGASSGGRAGAGGTSSGGASSGGRTGAGGAPSFGGGPGNDGTCGPSCEGTCVSGYCSVVIVSGQVLPGAVAVDATSVYWVTFDGVGTSPKTGGTARTLATDLDFPWDIALDGAHVYITYSGLVAEGAVLKVPLGGGTVAVLAPGGQPEGVAVDASSLYWVDAVGPGGGSVQRMPLAGGGPVALASQQNRPMSLAVDRANAYWTNFGGTVMSVPLAGGPPVVLAAEPSTGNDGPAAIAIDADHVYWAHSGDNGSIRRVPKAGGALTVLAPGQPWPQDIVVDGGSVYWTAQINFGPGAVMKMPIGGGPATVIANASGPNGLAVDGEALYWSDFQDGTLSRVTPK